MNVISRWPVTCIFYSVPIYSKEGVADFQMCLNLHFIYSLIQSPAAWAKKTVTLKYTPRAYVSSEKTKQKQKQGFKGLRYSSSLLKRAQDSIFRFNSNTFPEGCY